MRAKLEGDVSPSSIQDVSYRCPECGFTLWNPIARFSTSTLGLYDDERFPGRCLLVLDTHFEDFALLDREVTMMFMEDSKKAARILQRVTGASRVNYAILGNAEPHIHIHLIPRVAGDPIPDKSPWSHPEPATPMTPQVKEQLIAKIAAHAE